MTTTQDRPAPLQTAPVPRPAGRRPGAAPVQRGPLVAAVLVLLLWGLWLLVPEGARLDLLGGGPATAPDTAEGEDGAPAAAPADAPAVAQAPAVDPPAPLAPQAAQEPQADVAPQATVAVGEPAPVAVPRAGDGTFAVAPGTGPQVGDGRLVTYTVEVEGGVPLVAAEVAVVVESVLADPRSWTGQGEWALQRVDADPDARIVLTTPDTTDRMCAPLQTRGEVSCRNGDDVVLNAVRWTQGATTWGEDVVGYRQYLVNHELGHYLGSSHVACPVEGSPAPVMLQQTLGLQGCAPNAWPYP